MNSITTVAPANENQNGISALESTFNELMKKIQFLKDIGAIFKDLAFLVANISHLVEQLEESDKVYTIVLIVISILMQVSLKEVKLPFDFAKKSSNNF